MAALKVDGICKLSAPDPIVQSPQIIPALIIWGLVMVKAGFFIFLKRASVALRGAKSLNGRPRGKKRVDANSAVLEAEIRATKFQ